MPTHEKKQSKSLTEKNKKYECEICGRKLRISKNKDNICDNCKRNYKIKE